MNPYLVSKKIHRYLVLIITVMTIIMAGTGLLIDYPLARFIHGNISKLFTTVLVLMAASGLTMYLYPWFKK